MFRNVENLTDPIINSSGGSGVQDSGVVPADETSPAGQGPAGPRSGTQTIEREVALLARFDRFTERTITAPDDVVAELTAIRQRGWATNVEERHVGVCGIAAPVLARSGVAHAAIGLQGPSVRLTSDRLRELAPLVTAAADEVAAIVIRV